MGERAQKVIVHNSKINKYWSQWGGQHCANVLALGESGLDRDIAESKAKEQWLDVDLAEGGYLVDFDMRRILLFSWDQEFVQEILSEIASAWPGWVVEEAPAGVDDFVNYVEKRT